MAAAQLILVPAARPEAQPAPPARPRVALHELLAETECIADTIEALDDEQMDPEAREALTRMLLDSLSGTREKVDRTAAVIANFEASAAAAKRESERLAKRAKYFESAGERLEKYVLGVLGAAGIPKLEGNTATLAARKNPAALAIDEEALIPWDYLRLPEPPPPPDAVPDKAAIKKALAAGTEVPGCRLVSSFRLVRS